LGRPLKSGGSQKTCLKGPGMKQLHRLACLLAHELPYLRGHIS